MMNESEKMTFGEMTNVDPGEYDNVKITDLPISIRIINRLLGIGINNVSSLLKCYPSDLMQIKGVGKNSLDEILSFCAKLSENDSMTSEQSSVVPSVPISLFAINRDEIAVGNFSFFDDFKLTAEEENWIQKYKNAYEILGEQLVFECIVSTKKVIPIVKMLDDFKNATSKYIEIWTLVNKLPDVRKHNKAYGYINAFTLDEKNRNTLKEIFNSEEASLCSILESRDFYDVSICCLLKQFFKWCNFDLEKEIEELFSNLYANERIRLVTQMRVKGQTLEQIGNSLGITRERVRQIELKGKRIFSHLHSRIRIVSKISAERNGDIILTPLEIEEYCGKYTSDLLYFLKSYESANYTYDSQLEVFIVGDDSITDRIRNSIETLPEIVKASQSNRVLSEIAEEADVPLEMLEKAFLDAYRLTGEVYHRYRLSLAAIYERILDTYYPHGFKAYDSEEIHCFRKIIADEYGDVDLPTNDRALTSRVASICILCDKGVYRLKKKDYLPKKLANKICEYIENSENTIFLTNTLFSVFEEELVAAGIDNKYFLQGIMHELFADKFVFRRDYISKDVDATSVYSAVVDFIKKSNFPVSKAQIQAAFPGITDIVINFSVGDSNVLNYFGEYLHASRLNILESEKTYLFNVIDELTSDGEAHHGREIYDIVSRQKPEILTRNAAMYPFSAFSVVEFLLRDKFQFSRPYVAKNGIEIGRPTERLHDLIYSNDEFTISQISEFGRENHFQISSLLEYVNECNDEFLLINDDTMMRIERTGIDESIAYQVENIISEAIDKTMPVKDLSVWSDFPPIKVPWTEWLIYSVIFKWGTKLVVATSSNQFRLSVPLVAPIDNFDPSAFKNMDKNDDSNTCKSDDLNNIDSLLEDLIDLTFLESDI